MDEETQEVVKRAARLAGVGLKLDSYPYCVKCRVIAKRNGKGRHGRERFKCGLCRVTFFGATHPSPHQLKLERARELFGNGYTLRQVVRVTGLTKRTLAKYRREWYAPGEVRCACGQDVQHQGWCWYRFQNSDRRQEFMARWHG